jgi:hypothetical protein
MAMSKPPDEALTGDKALRAERGDKAARKVFVTVGYHHCTCRRLLLCYPAGVVHPWGERRLGQPPDRPGTLSTLLCGSDARVSRLGVLDDLS